MSVGICIINKNGISLAADSAGTFGNRKMFYNSMNKVYNLSFNNKIGAITYGSTEIMNVPIEIILKEYRKYIDCNYVQFSDFFSLVGIFEQFLIEKKSYFKFDQAEQIFCSNFIISKIKEWGAIINQNLQNVDLSKEEKIDEIIEKLKNYVENLESIPDYDVSNYIKDNYDETIMNSIRSYCSILLEYKTQCDCFIQYICNSFNSLIETVQPLGLLFAGYDLQSAFPKCIYIQIYNFIGGKLKFIITDKIEESTYSSYIIPLAQPDVINTFIKGFSDKYMNAIPGLIKSEIDKRISLIEGDQTEIQKKFEDIQDTIVSILLNKSREEYINPLFESLHSLQIPDLASLAESLVNITSLKRKFSLDGYQQTVGGPTDVATISSNDGFIWIKRKHYFDKELNPHFERRYK